MSSLLAVDSRVNEKIAEERLRRRRIVLAGRKKAKTEIYAQRRKQPYRGEMHT